LKTSVNPVKERADRVNLWLVAEPAPELDPVALERRTSDLMGMGFKNFDALHLASAEESKADCLATCDKRFLAAAKRADNRLRTRVVTVIDLAKEIVQ
jgi:predicted nucleic acid-binding protein